jgi:hypothetical protein
MLKFSFMFLWPLVSKGWWQKKTLARGESRLTGVHNEFRRSNNVCVSQTEKRMWGERMCSEVNSANIRYILWRHEFKRTLLLLRMYTYNVERDMVRLWCRLARNVEESGGHDCPGTFLEVTSKTKEISLGCQFLTRIRTQKTSEMWDRAITLRTQSVYINIYKVINVYTGHSVA